MLPRLTFFSSAIGVTIVVLSIRPAMLAAFCSAERTTLVGTDDTGLEHVGPLSPVQRV